MGTAKGFVALIFGAWLLVTLPACEGSRHAEIMSTEDLRAKAELVTAPEPEIESAQSGAPSEGQVFDESSFGLSDPLVFAPEPPPSPAAPASEEKAAAPASEEKAAAPASEEKAAASASEEKTAASAFEEKAAASAFEEKAAASAFEEKAAASAFEEKAAASAFEAIVEEPVPAEEPVVEPKMEVAKLEPSDFVPEEPMPEPLPESAPAQAVESSLADVFFDYDQYAIRSDAIPVLEKDAGLLKGTYKDSHVLIEGHCDERGTVEYNLELGKRRAQAVKDYLVDLGIEESRIRIVSYGKERPFCTESDPSCWKQNRRGHFVRQ